jgi:hypothetical protein
MSKMTSGLPSRTSSESLYLAFDLSKAEWHLGFTLGAAQSPRERKIPAGDLPSLQREIQWAKQRFGLPESTPVRSRSEAGRVGFWLQR